MDQRAQQGGPNQNRLIGPVVSKPLTSSDPAEVVVGIETDRGLWVTALVAAGYQLYAINPLAASRYRDRHNVGGAKSDAGDAKMLADLVRTDRHNHRQVRYAHYSKSPSQL